MSDDSECSCACTLTDDEQDDDEPDVDDEVKRAFQSVRDLDDRLISDDVVEPTPDWFEAPIVD